MAERQILIDGQWVKGAGKSFSVVNPYSGEKVADVGAADAVQVEEACAAAARAFADYRRLPARRRADVVRRLRDAVCEQREVLARILVSQCGKPVTLARAEVDRCIQTLTVAAEIPNWLSGHQVPLDAAPNGENKLGLALREPLGPIAAITPFNYPLNLTAHKLGPALAVGCTVVHKPASATPLDAFLLADVLGELQETGELPAGTYNLVPGPGSDVGEPLCASEHLRAVTFTGSAEVGRWLTRHAGMKKLTMELGSTAAAILCADADLADAVPRLPKGAFGFAGQSCISLQRIFVQRSLVDDFTERFLAETAKINWGDPADEDVLVGPLISPAELERAQAWIGEAVDQGARLLTGNTRHGNVLTPTVLTDVTPTMKVAALEVFAPVVSIIPFDDLPSAIADVNRNPQGLNLSVFTADLDRALDTAEALEAGTVLINETPSWRVDLMPYGGVKDSGLGREGARYVAQELTEPKQIIIRRRSRWDHP
jgi:acyl-CoA reductase-like NAD-dependent aldehyde dehydrogenase